MDEHTEIKKKRFLSNNKYLIVIILIAVALFYWILIRPSQIKSFCLYDTQHKLNLYSGWINDKGESRLNAAYEACLHQEGI